MDGPAGQEAFVALYEQHHGHVLAYTRRRLPEDAARDATAEVFLIAWRRWDVAAAGGLPWLYATAALVVRSARRGQGRRGALLGRLAAQPSSQVWPDHAPGHAERDAVLTAVRALPERDRELLLLTVWEGLDVPTAARVTGSTVGAAHVRLHRARRRLRSLLEAQGLAPPVTGTADPSAPPDLPAPLHLPAPPRSPTPPDPHASSARPLPMEAMP